VEDRLSVQVRGLSKRFGEHQALSSVNLEMRDGEFVALIGKSGSGKTTLLRILAGLEAPDSGTLLVPKDRTVVFQEPRLVPSKQVWKNVVIGLQHSKARRAEAVETLGFVGLEARADAWPATLSGGEAQRVALARALLRRPSLLLLDEPFASLDALTRLQMQDLVRNLIAKFSPATLIVTHDVEEAILLADRIILLRDGKFDFEIEVTIPRPRSLDGADFDRLRRMLLGELGVRL
jgi:sulfonate transport system ATP-binding protein